MTRQLTRSIPDYFVRLDDAVTSADRFLNVRDLQRARLNHNILLARGIHHSLVWQMDCQGGTYDNYTEYLNPFATGIDETRSVQPFLRGRVLLSPHVRKCACLLRASTSRAQQGTVYAVISLPRHERGIDAGDSVSISSATVGSYSMAAIPVPLQRLSKYSKMEVDIALYYTADEYSAVQDSAVVITATTGKSVSCATAGLLANKGDIMYFDDTTIEPRVIEDRSDSGGTSTLTARKAWFTNGPTTGNTLDTRYQSTLRLRNVTLYEQPVTDFDATVGAL